jgi:2Fe-2S ferredoxin
VTFLNSHGQKRDVQAALGSNVMMAAIFNGIPGIEGECGGSMACGTCHVYVTRSPAMLPGITDAERDILDLSENVRDNSRLGCQIVLTQDLDGLMVELPSI